jgi:hypothetical protein
MDNSRKTELEGVYRLLDMAFQKKNLEGIASYVAQEWTGRANDQSVSRDQLIENVRGQFERFNDIRWERTIEPLREDNGEFTVRASGIYRAVEADSGKTVEMMLVNDDTWAKRAGGWQIVRSISVE